MQFITFSDVIDIKIVKKSIDARDKITSGHSTRVKMFANLIAQEFGMEKNDISILEKAAALHDIGKIGTSRCTDTI